MKMSWTVMKNLINAVPSRSGLYLSIIDEEGFITSANTNMKKGLELQNPLKRKANFFDLIHPLHINHFKKIIKETTEQKEPATVELFVKNGFYHPMKWQVNFLQQVQGSKRTYLCMGYNVVDSDKQKKFDKLFEKHHRLIIENLAGIIFHDEEGELIAANQFAAGLLNTDFDELYRPKSISYLWNSKWTVTDENGELVPFEKTPFIKALKSNKPEQEILQIKTADGDFRWMLFNSQLLQEKNNDEDISFIVSNIIDITNEKNLSEKLKEKNALINSFVNQTPNLAWIVDEDSRLLFASNAFYQYFGIDKKDSLNKKVSELVPATVFKSLYEKHIEVLESGEPLKAVEKIRLANGTNYISHINIFPLDNISGKKTVGGYAINLPDTIKIETNLRETNERLLTLSQVASDAIWEWDMQTGEIFRNDILMQMIGYQQDHVKGLSWWLRRIHPEDRNRVSEKVKDVTESGQHSWQDEYRFKCADGQYKHVRDKGFVIYENGLPVKMIGSLHDISALKELENKLASEKLQQQKEISETIIQVQEKERSRIGRELHDNVNQILSSALLFSEMLTTGDAEQKQAKEKTVQYITAAIEEIRKLSKELVIPHLKEQGLIDGIRGLIDDIHLTNKIKVSFSNDIEVDLLSSGKRITLFRIVQEQIKNIIKHSKAKKAQIILKNQKDTVQLIIKDNGVGFDPRQTHRGIGLSNIYERVSFYNGMVDIQTKPGNGCTVIVTLPLQ